MIILLAIGLWGRDIGTKLGQRSFEKQSVFQLFPTKMSLSRFSGMGDLSILLLLQIRRIVAVHDRIPTQNGVEANLLVDLLHPLEVGLGGTLGAEDDVLYDVSCPLMCICLCTGPGISYHFLQRETLRLGHEEPDEAGTDEGEKSKQEVGAVGDLLEKVGSDLANAVILSVSLLKR